MGSFHRQKQVGPFKDFHTFRAEFQRLATDAEMYDKKLLIEELKDKVSFELQKYLASSTLIHSNGEANFGAKSRTCSKSIRPLSYGQ